MKIWLAIFFLGSFPFTMLSQTLTPEQKQQYIAKLDSSDEDVRFQALRDILENEISEALPKIEQNFWKEQVTHQTMSLMAMEKFHSPNLQAFARAFFDSSESLAKKPLAFHDALQLKVEATYYLHKTGDYSTTKYVFDLLRRDREGIYAAAEQTLKSIIQHVPEYADSAKEELLRITREDPFWFSRTQALGDLVEIYGQEMFPEIVNMFVDDDAPAEIPRMHALELLFKMNYPGLHDLLKDRLSTEPAPPYRGTIADSLLRHFGGVDDYLFIQNYMEQEADRVTKSLMGFALRDFKPPVPPPAIPIIVLLDSLVSSKQQVFTLGWLTDASFVTELDADLQSARSLLLSGESLGCAQAVKAFQNKIDFVYRDSLNPDPRKVTVEGWKFLYYNAQYILDRLPQIPAVQEHILSVPSQYATIQAAVNASHAGDVIEVSPGTYSELVSINNKDSLTLRTTGGIDQVTVRGFHLQQSNVITIKGFIVDATGTTEHGIELLGGNNQNTDVTIEACEIKNAGNDRSGISIARGNPRTRIVNNRIHDNGRNGIVIIDATGGPHYVINNTIVRNGWNGVNVARQHVISLVNNILSFNGTKSGSTGGRYGVLREAMTGPGEASGIMLLSNLIVGNNGSITSTSSKDLGNYAQTLDATDSGNYTTVGTEGVGVTAAPELAITDVFVSGTDLRLKSGSFAINRGLNSYTPPDAKAGAIPAVDYEGEGRPKGAAVDVGADEKE